MPMQPKPLKQIIQEIEILHRRLLAHLKECKDQCTNDREAILLEFIIEQQTWLAKGFEEIEKTQFSDMQETWFYVYTDSHPRIYAHPELVPYGEIPYEEIIREIRQINADVVSLFEYLNDRSESRIPSEVTSTLLHHLSTNMNYIDRGSADTL